jgi:hypothetical protein
MYIAAALCMWVLRAWKIGQLEQLAAEEGKTMDNIDPLDSRIAIELGTPETNWARSSLASRLFTWKRV